MFPTLVRRMADKPIAPMFRNTTRTPLTGIYNSRFRPKKLWPPDFSKLHEKQQFRLERKYKRRVKLATMRPRWDRYVKLAQLSSVAFVLVYSVLFMDWNTETQPFQGVRNTFWGAIGSLSPGKRHDRRNPELPTAADEK
ncbi:Uu.00g075030.m01.CDS01 [Anthostomella pinea]|uniref:Uu.00g075030.m01.CDS01 n=1 Tax=Anthostomella pinea TaxID=933095 RepID=A0AAI8VWT1_9PEZI|nr:Uu.00g075030.m01.CDS01 [Anthostomella pinea]